MTDFNKLRQQMVINQLEARDITDKKVLAAMREVPREEFVPQKRRNLSYQDSALPIGQEQTISQPYIVAKMCQLLEISEQDKILDIGAGSGYQTAILSRIAHKVIAVEIIKDLTRDAQQTLEKLGYNNAQVVVGDGRDGYAPEAPYDGIKSAAASSQVPEPWKNQLKVGGRIVLPLQTDYGQTITRLTKHPGGFTKEQFSLVMFVPLV